LHTPQYRVSSTTMALFCPSLSLNISRMNGIFWMCSRQMPLPQNLQTPCAGRLQCQHSMNYPPLYFSLRSAHHAPF
jgi:hypothetical protein